MSTNGKEKGGLLLIVILLLGGLVGAGGAAFYFIGAREADQLRAEVDREQRARVEAEHAHRAALMREATVLATARDGCRTLSTAVEAYVLNAGNPGNTDDERLPEKPQHLLTPPFGGPSFLPNEAALLDPWGKPYRFELARRADNTPYLLILTTAPDGTHISQFGTGVNARPRK